MHEWDVVLTIGLFIVGGFMAIAGWLFKKRLETYDEHLKECQDRAVTMARMDERLSGVECQVKGIHSTVQWFGDCITTVGAKLGVDLPARPR